VSAFGAFDMVGNLEEWVADWVPLSTDCPGWGAFSDDWMCFAGADADAGPGALLRGGGFGFWTDAGPLTVFGYLEPSYSSDTIGFRCAR
jgi:formylglycine-generating enzyme required for sulfatase activity